MEEVQLVRLIQWGSLAVVLGTIGYMVFFMEGETLKGVF